MTKESDTLPPLPGDCIPIPQVQTTVHDADGQVQWLVATHPVADLDLDGHGSPVILVPPDQENLNQYSMWWRLFIRRCDCGHEMGVVIGMQDPVPEDGTAHGLRNFGVVELVAPNTGYQGVGYTIYAFDGQQYVSGRIE